MKSRTLPAQLDRLLTVSRAARPVGGPDGALYYASNESGHAQVYRLRSPRAAPERLTRTDDRLVPEFWTRHGLVLQGDRGGNENWQLSLLRENGELVALTHDERAIHSPVRRRPDGDAVGLSWNPGGQQDMLLGELLLPTGELRAWLRPTGFWNWLAWSPSGDQAVVVQLFGSWSEAYLLDRDGHLTRILPHARLVEAAEWTQAGLFVATDAGEDFLGVAQLDPAQPEQIARWIVKEPRDALALVAAPDGRTAAAVINTGISDEIRVIELPGGTVIGKTNFGTGIVLTDHTGETDQHLSWSHDGRRLFAAWDTPSRPADIVAYPEGERWTGVNASAPTGLIEPVETSYESFDGLTIPGLAYRIDATPRPTVCLFHGGPEGQWRAGYAPLHHLLNAIGINTFAPNVRGSNGYGFHFQSLDDKTLRWDSVKDGCEAARWLRRTGQATQVAAMGGSYGGFMTLAVIVEDPELWDAAVDTVGIARWRTFFEKMPPWRGVLRMREYGDPFGAEADFLESISPIHRAASIRTPLLVVHGRNDPRVPVGESEQIAKTARNAELLIFENEGHGIARHENQVPYHRKILEFLQAHLTIPAIS
ncbi:MAG TPA: prolyl oligopeptidase family serine peptidase [Candidatus Dormibacteraeota bacterium]|nr:prolyl oligopeptidase family serine peptidase [Candidatus Dormibacteraeota bacterium]